jgi:hypothetical protein
MSYRSYNADVSIRIVRERVFELDQITLDGLFVTRPTEYPLIKKSRRMRGQAQILGVR